jgi:ATPase subunit of ABC transporter with duplicated ATPase domains
MSIWRKVIRSVTLQCFRKLEVVDVVTRLPDDDDVLAEQALVLSGQSKADHIVIKNLSKVYDDGKIALDNLCLGIAPGECFGLLGINGTIKD